MSTLVVLPSKLGSVGGDADGDRDVDSKWDEDYDGYDKREVERQVQQV